MLNRRTDRTEVESAGEGQRRLNDAELDIVANKAADKVFELAYARLGKNALKWLTFALGVGLLYVGHAIIKDGWHPFK